MKPTLTSSAQLPEFWPDGARVAVSLVVNVEEGSELSIERGDDSMEPVDEFAMFSKGSLRNLPNESNYRYGLTHGAPRVAELLRDRDMRATWTCAAQALEGAPQVVRLIQDGGHEVCAHGLRWIPQLRMDEATERDFIRKAAESIERSCGVRPQGWLSRYFNTLNTRRLLVEEGFAYHMDDFSSDVPFWDNTYTKPLLVIPYQLDTNDMKMWAHPSYTPQQWLHYACQSLDWLVAEATRSATVRMLSLGVHLRIIGRPGRIGAYRDFLDYVAAKPAAATSTRAQIAAAWAQIDTP